LPLNAQVLTLTMLALKLAGERGELSPDELKAKLHACSFAFSSSGESSPRSPASL